MPTPPTRKPQADKNVTSALLMLVADIRAAVGDPNGRLMQDELVEHCRALYRASKKPKAKAHPPL